MMELKEFWKKHNLANNKTRTKPSPETATMSRAELRIKIQELKIENLELKEKLRGKNGKK